MPKIVLAEALKALHARNDAMIAVYRDGSRSLPPGPVANLAASMVEQRKDLAKSLASLAASPACRSEIDMDSNPQDPAASVPDAPGDAAGLLMLMEDAEDSDYESLSELAGSVLPISSSSAELLASEANGAKKRAAWARDHLDLMGLAKP